jgi:hypothetical protein
MVLLGIMAAIVVGILLFILTLLVGGWQVERADRRGIDRHRRLLQERERRLEVAPEHPE